MNSLLLGVGLVILGFAVGGIGVATAGMGVGIPIIPIGIYLIWQGWRKMEADSKSAEGILPEKQKPLHETRWGMLAIGGFLVVVGFGASAFLIGLPIVAYGAFLLFKAWTMDDVSYKGVETGGLLPGQIFDDTKKPLINMVNSFTSLIKLQIDSSGCKLDKLADDHWAMGYVFGIYEQIAHSLNIDDQIEAFGAIATGFKTLFDSPSIAGEITSRCLALQADEYFLSGRETAAVDFMQFVNEKRPMIGLASYLRAK